MNLTERATALAANPLYRAVLSPECIACLAGLAEFDVRVAVARHAVAVAAGWERV